MIPFFVKFSLQFSGVSSSVVALGQFSVTCCERRWSKTKEKDYLLVFAEVLDNIIALCISSKCGDNILNLYSSVPFKRIIH